MATIYHSKCMTTLQMLRLDAALASQRIIDKSRKVGVKGKILECFKCQCPIPFNMQKHLKTPEHNLVVNYTTVKCCGRFYNSRGEFEEHKLSLKHLKRTGEIEKRAKLRKEKELEVIKELGLEDKPLQEQQKALNEQ